VLGDGTFTSKPIAGVLAKVPVYSSVKRTFLALGIMNANPHHRIEITGKMSKKLCLDISGYKDELINITTKNPEYDIKLCLDKPAIIQTEVNSKPATLTFYGPGKFKMVLEYLEKNNELSEKYREYITNLNIIYHETTENKSRIIDKNINNYISKNLYRLDSELLVYKKEQDGSISEIYKTPNQLH
jgi:hypothetical protein